MHYIDAHPITIQGANCKIIKNVEEQDLKPELSIPDEDIQFNI